MAEDDWGFRNVQHLVHHLDGDVGQVDQHPQTVHFHNELLVRKTIWPYFFVAKKQLSEWCFNQE